MRRLACFQAVMDNLINRLKEGLEAGLPGTQAQYAMAHQVRRSHLQPGPDAREAGVLALLYPRREEWHIVFIQRPSHNAADRHGGQISFPGGQRDPEDADLVATALREAYEEIQAPVADVHVLGQLSELFIPVSNFRVYPTVGYLDYAPSFVPQPSEVAEIIEVPFGRFFEPQTRRLTDIPIAEKMVLREVPYFDLHGRVLWGATAMMMGELLAVAGYRWD